ncbi:MAG: DUF1819 family protein, partial [Phycisphaerae bacterium]|nr:DUF1819 family protein [Phycisphaerae bacterium]
AGALLVPESRKIAGLLLNKTGKDAWKEAVEGQNILQARSISTAKRIAALIRSRLELMDAGLWKLIADGDSLVATHAVFAASIKHCVLLGDYLDLVVRDQFNQFEERLSKKVWDEYINHCRQRDPMLKEFPPTTATKIRTNVHKILVEAGYLRDRKSLLLQRPDVAGEVIDYLQNKNESYVLKCMQV